MGVSLSGGLNERTTVEVPFVAQLVAMGWQYREGDTDGPDFTDRAAFGDVLLKPLPPRRPPSPQY